MERKDISYHARLANSIVGQDRSVKQVEVQPFIACSWNRCLHEFGLDPDGDQPVIRVDSDDLDTRRERLGYLLAIAQVEMAGLYQQFAGSGFSVLLADPDGVVLDLIGDQAFSDSAMAYGLVQGGNWSERHQGTNSIGTCTIEQQSVLVHHSEHFLSRNVRLTGCAAPVFNHEGKLLAVLNISSFSRLAQQHTLALIDLLAQTIENRAFLSHFRNHYALRFHSRPEAIGTLREGILALDESGRILAANRSALSHLGLKRSDVLAGRTLRTLFNIGIEGLLSRKNRAWLAPLPLYETRHGNRFYSLLKLPENSDFSLSAMTPIQSVQPVSASLREDATIVHLDNLQFGEPRIAYNVHCAKRVLRQDIPILLTGETGTGKEVFAKAVHAEYAGASKPFVAVNCVAIPESLIESELFGYTSGAFTGASRGGRRGKILQANGGTLFLDEIGDMPLLLQARLLRVLEEREVVPLGGESPVKIDIKLISATHRNLKELVAEGKFREDLYYRLQGISLTLPPLRERQDRQAIIRHLVALEANDDQIQLSPAAMKCLDAYAWPGNLRQLRNVLRTTLALREGDEIDVCDLPEEFSSCCQKTVIQITGESPGSEVETTAIGEVGRLSVPEAAERVVILQNLIDSRWNMTLAAKRMFISRNTLYRKMKNLRIDLNK
ncbi:sigma-54-dependent Fis family transcriptional regulator [Thiobacillus sp.]|uniref:sigma-54-dependent Fis family transcriptional regulator n=1 Tax=Thiobacillus sp. TaxID=924 RepID=UPI0025F99351|nr:sigma-54-dependent Fis family transcriptional regulator [Thiobacillus sp.]